MEAAALVGSPPRSENGTLPSRADGMAEGRPNGTWLSSRHIVGLSLPWTV